MIDIDFTKLQLIFDFMYEKKVYFNFSEFMEENITHLNQTHNLKKYNDKVSIIIEGGPHIDIKRILSNLRTEKLACYKYIPIYKNNANEEYVGEVYALYKYANGEVVVDCYNRISYEL